MRGLEECVDFFRSNGGFNRLMEGLFDIYLRYERCFGAVRLINPSQEEERAISEFFKRDYYNQALIRIGLAEFERQVQRVFSHDLNLSAVLEAYLRRPLYLRKTEVRSHSGAFANYLEQDLSPRYVGTDAEPWLKDLLQNIRKPYREWALDYTENPEEVSSSIESVCEALNNLPFFSGSRERLPEFSLRFTGDPHAFDYMGRLGFYFMRALAKTFGLAVPSSTEEYSALCGRAGLLTEGVLSKVTLRGVKAAANGVEDAVCAAYNAKREPFMLTLENMYGFDAVSAVNGKVYIMESLNVFASVNEQVRDVECTLLCAENSFNSAFTFLLDMMVKSGAELYYSGGMDYKGMQLADRVYLRYPKAFRPWRYGRTDYDTVFPASDYYLPENNREMGLHSEDLASLLSYMRKKGKSSPQTALIGFLVEDIKKAASPLSYRNLC